MSFDKPITKEDIYKAKSEQRKLWAKLPLEEKINIVMRLQQRNYELNKAAGRKAPRPWNMSEEQYERETRNIK